MNMNNINFNNQQKIQINQNLTPSNMNRNNNSNFIINSGLNYQKIPRQIDRNYVGTKNIEYGNIVSKNQNCKMGRETQIGMQFNINNIMGNTYNINNNLNFGRGSNQAYIYPNSQNI